MFIQRVGRQHTFWCVFGCAGQLYATNAEAVDAFLAHRCEMGG